MASHTVAVAGPRVCSGSPSMKTFALIPFLFAASMSLAQVSPVPPAPTPTAPVAYGDLRPDFLARHTTNYSFEVGGQSAVKNQGAIGVCHIYALTSQFEQRFQKRTNQPMTLSSAYLVYKWWLGQANEAFQRGALIKELQMGGYFFKDWELVHNVGLMPEAVWAQNPKFNNPVSYGRMDEYIRNIIDKAILAGKTMTVDQQRARYAQALDEVKKLINGYMGTPPESFLFNGQLYTPMAFATKLFPELMGPYQEYEITNRRNAAWREIPQANGMKRIVPLNDIEKIAKQGLDSGFNVYLTYEHNGDFVDNKTGIMTIGGFYIPPGGGPIARKERVRHQLFDGGHAVQIVGYDLDPRTGNIVKWKIKNSWSEKAGTDGYYHMYQDYFRAFAFSVIMF